MGEIRKKMERSKQALVAVATYHYYAQEATLGYDASSLLNTDDTEELL